MMFSGGVEPGSRSGGINWGGNRDGRDIDSKGNGADSHKLRGRDRRPVSSVG